MAPCEPLAIVRVAYQSWRACFTEHDMDAVFDHADRIIVLDCGRIIADGTPNSIRADARVQKVYLGEGKAA